MKNGLHMIYMTDTHYEGLETLKLYCKMFDITFAEYTGDLSM